MTEAATSTPPAGTVPAMPPRPEGIVLRLRPVVHASPTPNGVHVRGWASNFTVDGGAGLWRLWQAMAPRLVVGITSEQAGQWRGRPEVARAAELILAQLREHDMLVEVPAGWNATADPTGPPPDLSNWLESVARDPAEAWRRLRAAQVTRTGGGPVRAAADRALAGCGVTLTADGAPADAPVDTLLAAGPAMAVGVVCRDGVGFVTPVGTPEQVERTAAAVFGRLGLSPDRDPTDTPPPFPLAALVGSAAAHRLCCALAGLPDPAQDAALLGEASAMAWDAYPSVLVAWLDPLRATYHPWLPAAPPRSEPTATLATALARLGALADPVLGVLPEPQPGDLPQVPAALALAGPALGVAATTDAARLGAALRAAELALTNPGSVAKVAVGVDDRHARGVGLRWLAHAALPRLDTTAVGESDWAGAPAARRWWKALTLRFAILARARVRRLAPDAVHAEITVDGAVLSWAVEASPDAAVAFAALAATGLTQARQAGVPVGDGAVVLSGAAPASVPDRLDAAAWAGPDWYWPAGVDGAEDRLQSALRRLVGGDAAPVPEATAPDLLRSLAATGFAAWSFVHEERDDLGEGRS